MAEHPRFPNFDPDFCVNAIKIGAIANLVVLGATVIVLMAVTPEPDLCPDWQLPDQGRTSVWFLVAFCTALPAAWTCYIAKHPKWFERTMVESLSKKEFIGEYPSFLFPVNFLMVTLNIGWTCMCGIPLLFALGTCTRLLRL